MIFETTTRFMFLSELVKTSILLVVFLKAPQLLGGAAAFIRDNGI